MVGGGLRRALRTIFIHESRSGVAGEGEVSQEEVKVLSFSGTHEPEKEAWAVPFYRWNILVKGAYDGLVSRKASRREGLLCSLDRNIAERRGISAGLLEGRDEMFLLPRLTCKIRKLWRHTASL